jgi:EAL domain-containing protein (putative c-di-GMP-specific phosphodiesterase class I)
VLTTTADWIKQNLSENSICGRLGGDTFGICMPAEEFDQAAAEKMLTDFVVNDGKTEHRLLIHLGVYRVADRETDVSVMFDRAHMALTTIKEEYHVITAWYEESMREQVLWNQKISAELKEAIATGQIRPWLQPIVNRDGKAIGAEALVRWVHPAEGIRSPGSFIPVFEQNGMIADVDLHIWRCSCKILSRWKKEGNDQFISVNISPKDFLFLDVAGELKRLVREYGIEPKKLRIEITETVMMSDMEKRMAVLRELQDYGFIIEMDDFGSGYSSLNMLKDMPVDVLKIDMSFLRKSGSTVRARAIVREIIALAKALGIVSLTEGVETEEQYGQLMEMGCQLYQGYFFAKPMPEADYEDKFCAAG